MLDSDWQPNGTRTFQKRYARLGNQSSLWVRIHPKQDGTFEVRASQGFLGGTYVESDFRCIEDAMAFSDAEFTLV